MKMKYPSAALAGLKCERYDPGIRYSVETPTGAKYTLCNPAAADNSSAMLPYFPYHWHTKGSNHNRSAD